jgi:hypothetical protein
MTDRVAYLLHFVDPATGLPARYQHAGHYLGDTDSGREADRLQEHRDGIGSVLTAAARRAGLDFVIARTWPGGALKARQLKSRSGASYCPECNEHPLPGIKPRRLGAKYLTRRQREARQRVALAAGQELARSGQHSAAQAEGPPVREYDFSDWPALTSQATAAEAAELIATLRRGARAAYQAATREWPTPTGYFRAFDTALEVDGAAQRAAHEAVLYHGREPGERAEEWITRARQETPAHHQEDPMLRRHGRAAARDQAQQEARAQAEADALFAEADRLDDLAARPGGYRQAITADRAARIRAQLGADLVLGDADQLAAVPDQEPLLAGACMSAGCDCAYGHPDRPAGRPAAAQPGWADAARWIPGQERDESEMAGELLSEYAARAEDAWRRERTATAGERLAELAHDEQALGRARQDAALARAAREAATRSAYAAAADMQRSALGPEPGAAGGRSPLPRVLETSPDAVAPIAAALPDGTPRADPFLAGRGWQAQGGVYVRQPQVQAEPG